MKIQKRNCNLKTTRNIDEEERLKEKWTTTDIPPVIASFTASHGVQVPMPPNAEVIDFFHLFVTDEFFELILEQTNIYAKQ